MQRTAAQILVDQLLIHGVDRAYCVPGESYLAVLDAMYDVRDRLSLVICRQEGGAGNMAEAYGKLTNRPGICFVTRGPGATNAAIAVHTAQQDSTPMILFIGQVGTDFVEREAFQEMDYRRVFGSFAKWVASVDRADRVPEMIAHAFQVATSGRPGPVVLALPEDILVQMAEVPDARRYEPVQAAPSASQVQEITRRLGEAKAPIMIVGGRGWNPAAIKDLHAFAERNSLPVGCAFRYLDVFDNAHPNYVGDIGIGINPKLRQRVQASDLVLVVGPLLGEMTTQGYTLFDVPTPRQAIIHVHSGAESLGRVHQAAMLVNSGIANFMEAMRGVTVDGSRWAGNVAAGHAEFEAWQQPRRQPGAVQYPDIVKWLSKRVPTDTIFTNGAGNFATPLHRFHRHRQWPTLLAPTSGAMGYGIPAAVSAKLVHPDRMVICMAGDGDFLMTGQELATAKQYGANVIVLVINNGMYGTIRMHQEKTYPARVWGTELVNPDFVKLGEAYGCFAARITETSQFEPAFERAVASNQPALLELVIDPQALTPGQTLDEMRAAALNQGTAKSV